MYITGDVLFTFGAKSSYCVHILLRNIRLNHYVSRLMSDNITHELYN